MYGLYHRVHNNGPTTALRETNATMTSMFFIKLSNLQHLFIILFEKQFLTVEVETYTGI